MYNRSGIDPSVSLLVSLDVDEPQQLTYSRWYLVMISRVAQMLLEWTGDEEYAKRPKED